MSLKYVISLKPILFAFDSSKFSQKKKKSRGWECSQPSEGLIRSLKQALCLTSLPLDPPSLLPPNLAASAFCGSFLNYPFLSLIPVPGLPVDFLQGKQTE